MEQASEQTLVAQYVTAGLSPVTAQQIAEETVQHQTDARMAAPFAEEVTRNFREGVTRTIQELGLEA